MSMTAWLADLGAAAAAAEPVLAAFGKFFSRFHWLSLASALLIALGVWLWQRAADPAARRRGPIGYLFPRRIWLHRSALLDYRFVLVDKLLLASILGVGVLLIVPGADEAVVAAGGAAVDEAVREVSEDLQASLALVLGYTAALLIVEDFLRYWAHRLMHTSALLWQFHKVHHSPEVLVPFTQMRTHPVNGLVNLARSLLAFAIVTGAFVLIFPGELNAITIFGINGGRFLFDVMGSHLRHSHVWLTWGPILSRILISPAQHQIHHSRLRRHWNRNYGSQFAIWDWLFGTLYVPARKERIAFGLAEEDAARMRTVRGLYLEPFRAAARLLRSRRAHRREALRA